MNPPQRRLASVEKIDYQYSYSGALQRIGRDEDFIRGQIRRDPRKIIPVAVLARRFGISKSQLWKWIRARMIAKKPRIRRGQKQGVAKSAALRFIKTVKACQDDQCRASEDDGDYWHALPRERFQPEVELHSGRPSLAREKIRAVWQSGIGQAMNPQQFAKIAGVSRSTVNRTIALGILPAWNRTRCRKLIGKRPRTPKKAVAFKNRA